MKLNLGCADRRLDGFLNVDICPPADQLVDLAENWPWPESSADEVFAADIFEHLPDKRHTMNELWRVLKPGGLAKIEVPSAAHGAGAFCDPTHVSFWTASDFEYYEKGNYARERFRASYGIKADFRIVSLAQLPWQGTYDEVWKVVVILEALK